MESEKKDNNTQASLFIFAEKWKNRKSTSHHPRSQIAIQTLTLREKKEWNMHTVPL